MNIVLKVLLDYSKKANSSYDIKAVEQALRPCYGFELEFEDIIRILLGAYEEAIRESRFELGAPSFSMQKLLMAPLNAHSSRLRLKEPKVGEQDNIKSFYADIVRHILGELRLTRVDWMPEYSGLSTEEVVTASEKSTLSVKEATVQVLKELRELPLAELRAELSSHSQGPFATALKETSAFLSTLGVQFWDKNIIELLTDTPIGTHAKIDTREFLKKSETFWLELDSDPGNCTTRPVSSLVSIAQSLNVPVNLTVPPELSNPF